MFSPGGSEATDCYWACNEGVRGFDAFENGNPPDFGMEDV